LAESPSPDQRPRQRRSEGLIWTADYRPSGVCYPARMRLALLFFLCASSVSAQTDLQNEIRRITADADGKVAVACWLPGSALNCDLEAHSRPPMQSVFKLPLAVFAFHLVEEGRFSLDQAIRFLPSDRILPETYSPLQDKYPTPKLMFRCESCCAWPCRLATT
jgi:hypothetical protein